MEQEEGMLIEPYYTWIEEGVRRVEIEYKEETIYLTKVGNHLRYVEEIPF